MGELDSLLEKLRVSILLETRFWFLKGEKLNVVCKQRGLVARELVLVLNSLIVNWSEGLLLFFRKKILDSNRSWFLLEVVWELLFVHRSWWVEEALAVKPSIFLYFEDSVSHRSVEGSVLKGGLVLRDYLVFQLENVLIQSLVLSECEKLL